MGEFLFGWALLGLAQAGDAEIVPWQCNKAIDRFRWQDHAVAFADGIDRFPYQGWVDLCGGELDLSQWYV